MKKVLSAITALTSAFVMTASLSPAFALTTGMGADGDYLLVSEDFENNDSMIDMYLDGTKQSYNSTGAWSSSSNTEFTLVNSEVYGIGNAYKSGRSTGRTASYGNFAVINTNSENSKPNLYAETEFDVILNSDYSTNDYADLVTFGRQNGSSYDDLAVIRVNKTTNTFWLNAWPAAENSTRTPIDLNIGYEKGKTYRIKIVFHITDSSCTAAREIVGVYINGVNALGKNAVPKKYYMVQKASIYENVRFGIANLNYYDNYAMYAYSSEDGKSPIINKGILVSLIRENDTDDTQSVYYNALNAAKTVYENKNATQNEVDAAVTALEDALNAPTGYTSLLKENFENETHLKFTKADGTEVGTLMNSESIYGMGNLAYKGSSIEVSDLFDKVYIMNEAEGYSNKSNTYFETEFDVLPATMTNYRVGLTSDKSTDGTDFTGIRFSDNGKIMLSSKTEKRSGTAENYELSDYEVNKAYRVRIVVQASDENSASSEKITAVYINGKNVLPQPRYFATHSYGKVGYFNRIRLQNAYAAQIDNISISTYQSIKGLSPNVNKGALITLIRDGEKNVDAADETAAAKLIYENPDAVQNDVDAVCKELYNSLYYETLVNEDFESDNPPMFICDATTQTNTTSTYSSYGIGKAMSITTERSTFHMTPFDVVIVKDANASGTAVQEFADNKKNLYVETEFDTIIKAQRTNGDESVYLGYNNDPNQTVAEIVFKRDNKIYLKAKDSKNGDNAEIELGTFEVGKPIRIKIVMHITDSNTSVSLEEIQAVYVNGENMLDKTYYLNTKYAYDTIFVRYANNISLDNIGVYKYVSSGSETPIVNKGKLVALLREKTGNASQTTEYTMASQVYENKSSSQEEVDSAYSNLLIATDGDTIIKNEFTWDKITEQSINSVTSDIDLVTVFKSSLGSLDVEWTSSDADFVSETGKVMIPKNDKEVTLTARLTSGQYSGVFIDVPFNVTIKGDASENTDLFKFSQIGFKSGDIASSVPRKGGSVSSVKLLSRDTTASTVLVAVYLEDKTLYSTNKAEVSPQTIDSAVTVQLNAALPEQLTGCTIKVFAWKFNNLIPVMRVFTYNVDEHIVNGSKIFIAGDSTAHTYTSEQAPQTGWGQVFDKFTNTDVITVSNYALGGRGAESFYNESNYTDNIKNVISGGDYLFVQFGHNDYKNGSTAETFKKYIKKYIADARERGAVPVIITPITRCVFNDGSINEYEQNMKVYADAAKEAAEEENVVCLDLFSRTVNYLNELGETEALKLYLGTTFGANDVTHFNERGAEIYAGFVRDLINESTHSSIDSLKDCMTAYEAQ